MPRFINPNPYHTPQQQQPTLGADPTGGATIDALLLRAKAMRQAQGAEMPAQIASPWQGASMMVNRLAEGLQARGAEEQAAAGRAELGQIMSRQDPVTGQLSPQDQARAFQLDPDGIGMELYKTGIQARQAAAQRQAEIDEWNRRHGIEAGEKEKWSVDPNNPNILVSSSGDRKAMPQGPETWKPDPNDPNVMISSTGDRKAAPQAPEEWKPDPSDPTLLRNNRGDTKRIPAKAEEWKPDPANPNVLVSSNGDRKPIPQGPETWKPDPTDPTKLISSYGNEKYVEKPEDKSIKTEQDLRKEYIGTPLVKNLPTVQNGYERMKSGFNQVTSATDDKGKSVGDIAIIYGFMKLQDPDSVVREGEFATAANAGGVAPNIMNLYNKVLNGEMLPPGVREGLMAQAKAQYNNYAQQVRDSNKRYLEIAKSSGVDPAKVLIEPKAYDEEDKPREGAPNYTPPPVPGGPSAPTPATPAPTTPAPAPTPTTIVKPDDPDREAGLLAAAAAALKSGKNRAVVEKILKDQGVDPSKLPKVP